MVISTYQAASGAGQAAMDELELQTKEVLEGKEVTKNIFPFQVSVLGQHSLADLPTSLQTSLLGMKILLMELVGGASSAIAVCVDAPVICQNG